MRYIVFLILFVSSLFSKELIVGVGLSLEPYVFQKSNSGIELDIVKDVLKMEGYNDLKMKYIPFLRIASLLDNKKIDIATTINESSGVQDIYYSDYHVSYQNVVISLKSNHIKVNNLKDLKDLKIISFQNAKNYLGKKYNDTIPKMRLYQELANQKMQVKLLFTKRVDAIILDINIFKYIRKNIKNVDVSAKINIDEIFPETKYKVAFLDKKIRDDFNIGLKKLKSSDKYEKIFNKYIK